MAFGIDDAIGAGIGIFGNLLSGQMNANASMERQDSANAFSAQQYATRYQTTVKDMEAAGLNPMLAYSQGAGSAPSGATVNATPYGNMGDAANAGRMASAQVANIQADTENKRASAELIAGQAAAAWASAGQSHANTGLINSQVDKIIQDIENAKTDQQRISALTDNLRVQRDNLIKEGYNLTEVGNQLRATVSKLQAEVPLLRNQAFVSELEARLKSLDVQAGEGMGNIGREAGQLKPVFDILRGLLRK